MVLSDILRSSVQSLRRTKGRSFLTMIGIVIGVLSVILVLSIGEAAERYILVQISALGSDVLFVTNGSKVQEGEPTLFVKETLTPRDLARLELEPWVSLIAGKLMQTDQLTANGFDTRIQLVGTMPDEIRLNDLRTTQGTFFTRAAVDSRAREAVLGHEVARKAFGVEDPIGKTVKISGIGFRVVGVMEAGGTKAFQNVDTQVYVPVTTALDLYHKEHLTYIAIKSHLPLVQAKRRIEDLLRDRHNILNPDNDLAKDDFNVTTQEDAVKSARTITNILQILLISIAAISLLVGGIGIMNIMYVAVTERIKEIGLRKSLGARHRDILGQFLIESMMQTLAGGILGTIFGTVFSWIAIQVISRFQTGWTFAVSLRGIGLGIGVSLLIGIVFGYFPARRASRLTPMEAMRSE